MASDDIPRVDFDLAEEETQERSHIADEISDLKTTILKVASERERLPQPLFWSLFRSRIDSIRKEKELQRVLSEELG
jgi:TATA-binding protein-associated factor Taf7